MAGAVAHRPELDEGRLGVDLGRYHLTIGTSFGPRVTGLSYQGGPNLFVSLPNDAVIDRPDSGVYRFRGGHRLWAAPEVPWITYSPDDEPCTVTTEPGSVAIAAPADRAGLAKRIRLTVEGEAIVVDHAIENTGPEKLELAPWAITQMPLGGTALIPVRGADQGNGLQANRALVLWPYTDITDPRLSWHGHVLSVAVAAGAVFKIGTGPDPGRIGYLNQGWLFTKLVTPRGLGEYPDHGAVGQFFMNDQFCELESVGAVSSLTPGEAATHREVWQARACPDLDNASHLLDGDGLA